MAATKKWFRAKDYGYGWVPQTFEGWLITITYCVLVTVFTIIFIQRFSDPLFNQIISVAIYLFLVGISSITLLITCYTTGEKPHWRWGNKKQ